MFTCNTSDCLQRAEIVKADLRPIGIDVHIRRFPLPELFRRENTKRPGFDIGMLGWAADYADPFDFIGLIFGPEFPGRIAPRYRREITAAARLTGERRLRAYGRIDIDLAKHAAPVIAFANVTAHDFFSDRIGCQTFQPIYGMDLAGLCRRGAAP